ncbi:MAG TPA: hypothetical protein VLH56_10585 [Dissulfurispiraceae bacterium]|nr:hypothetical protein [Dissulfurispiraceae bacterium]
MAQAERVKITLHGVDQIKGAYSTEKIALAIRNALNRATRSGRSEASDAIRNVLGMNIKKTDLDRKISMRLATRLGETRAEISVGGEPIILSYFGAKQGGVSVVVNKGAGVGRYGLASTLKGRGGPRGRVQVTVIKGKPTVLDSRTFIGMGRAGVPMVFRRRTSGKLYGKKVYSHGAMLRKPDVMRAVEGRIEEQWDKEWTNQMKQIGRQKAKGTF